MIYPVSFKKITSPYGNRTLPGRKPVFHFGTDFSGKNKTALAVCSMKIIKVLLPDEEYPCRFRYDDKKGFHVPVENIPSERAWTPYIRAVSLVDDSISFIYKHVKSMLSEGDEAEEGQEIAFIGDWGFSMGPHLHFEVLKNGKNVDPVKWLEGQLK